MKNIITKKLSALKPTSLVVLDESFRHAGHLAQDAVETHFKIKIISEKFENLPRITRHRVIYDLLDEELSKKIHALSIEALTPQEANAK